MIRFNELLRQSELQIEALIMMQKEISWLILCVKVFRYEGIANDNIFLKHQKLKLMKLLPQEVINDEIDLPELAVQIITESRSNAPA